MGVQYYLELLGTFVFAISGALTIEDKRPDWFGVGFIGCATAIGGGSVRDILLGSYPLFWIGNIYFLYAIVAGILAALLFYKWLIRLRKTFFLFDTVGIAFFTILGTEKALSVGVRPEIAALMGMFTAVMGGVIRDTITQVMPVILRKEIYASACLAGAILYLCLKYCGVERNISLLLASFFIMAIRLLAVRYNLSLPTLNSQRFMEKR